MKNEIINFLKENIENNKCIYNGFSFTKKLIVNEEEKIKIIHSISVYRTINGNIKISENDFTGIIYDKQQFINGKNTLKNNELKYLKFFFHDLLLFNNKKLYFKELAEKDTIKASFFYIPKKDQEELNISINLDNYINNISKTKIMHKNIKIKEKKIIMIVDLKRPQNQYRSKKEYLQSHLTIDSTILFFLKKIATDSNFLVLNSTGDGFIFIYKGNNLENDLNNFFQNLDEHLIPFIKFLNTIDEYYSQYAIRGIIKKCVIYELLSNEFYNDTVFISNELDWAFKDLNMCKTKEYPNAYYNFFIEKQLTNKKISNFDEIDCNCIRYIIQCKKKEKKKKIKK